MPPARAIHLAAASVALMLTAGCLGGSHETNSIHATGTIVTVGGPAAAAPSPIGGAEFRLVGPNQSATVRAGSDGRFAVDLPPGRYRVVITGHAPQSDGGWLPTTPSEVTIGQDAAKPIRLIVSIK